MLKLCSIKDLTTGIFLPPQSVKDEVEAKRGFISIMSSETDVARFPDEYSLYYLGKFNPENGRIDMDGPTEILHGTRAKQIYIEMQHQEELIAFQLEQKRQSLTKENEKCDQ